LDAGHGIDGDIDVVAEVCDAVAEFVEAIG
jgi:hypothetical protein